MAGECSRRAGGEAEGGLSDAAVDAEGRGERMQVLVRARCKCKEDAVDFGYTSGTMQQDRM